MYSNLRHEILSVLSGKGFYLDMYDFFGECPDVDDTDVDEREGHLKVTPLWVDEGDFLEITFYSHKMTLTEIMLAIANIIEVAGSLHSVVHLPELLGSRACWKVYVADDFNYQSSTVV